LGSFSGLSVPRFEISTGSFDAGQRMKRDDERNIKAVFQGMPNFTTQPIVGVNSVHSASRLDIRNNCIAELIDNVSERLFREVIRACLYVHNSMPRLDENFSWKIG
jgi:hypothetical protein